MILYEDAQLVVCCKPRGVLSAADSSGQESMAALLAPRTVFPVHRLDRDVPGVMVFAKTREAAAFLSAHLTAGKDISHWPRARRAKSRRSFMTCCSTTARATRPTSCGARGPGYARHA